MMKFGKSLKTLLLASVIVFNTSQLISASVVNKPNFGNYTYSYSEKKDYLEIDAKDSSFSFRIVDTNTDNKAGLVRLLDKDNDLVFTRHDLTFKDSVKEAQLFDLADKFLMYFFGNKKTIESQNEIYNNYLNLIRERFIEDSLPQKRIQYNFNNFFVGGFKSQENVEDLLMYSYFKYSQLIKEIKKTNPEQTFQSLLDNSNLWDKIRFLFLARDYQTNLGKLGYNFESPLVIKDYFELDLTDKTGKGLPYIKVEMNMNSIPESVNIAEIKDFLDGKSSSLFKYDSKGNYLYGGFRCEK
jgi:hypothetical protein